MTDEYSQPSNVISLDEARARRANQALPKDLTKEEARKLLGIRESLMDGDPEETLQRLDKGPGDSPDVA